MSKMDAMFHQGLISAKAGAKLKKLQGTKVQNSKMADFDDKGGRRDQGGVRDRGDSSVAGARHIDTKQDMGSVARASGPPSKGGRVGKTGQPGADAIDEVQTPAFPKQGSGKGRAGSRTVAPIARQGGQYGGGGRNTQ
jgi:hypothetical protein